MNDEVNIEHIRPYKGKNLRSYPLEIFSDAPYERY